MSHFEGLSRLTVMDTQVEYAGATVAPAVRWGITVIRSLVFMNFALVAVQPVSAGFFLSGYGHAVTLHRAVALALQVGTLGQAVTAVVLWRLGRIPARVAAMSTALLVVVFLQNGLGYTKRFWLHVPIGVGLFGGLIRQAAWLETLLTPASPSSQTLANRPRL